VWVSGRFGHVGPGASSTTTEFVNYYKLFGGFTESLLRLDNLNGNIECGST